jgi:CheY-like chemotaxis protein
MRQPRLGLGTRPRSVPACFSPCRGSECWGGKRGCIAAVEPADPITRTPRTKSFLRVEKNDSGHRIPWLNSCGIGMPRRGNVMMQENASARTTRVMKARRPRAKILVVEEDGLLLDLLLVVMLRAGLMPVPTPASLARRVYEREQPDVVVWDLSASTPQHLRLLSPFRAFSAPVIVLVRQEHQSVRSRKLPLGADEYVAVPFSHHQLVDRILARLPCTFFAPFDEQ